MTGKRIFTTMTPERQNKWLWLPMGLNSKLLILMKSNLHLRESQLHSMLAGIRNLEKNLENLNQETQKSYLKKVDIQGQELDLKIKRESNNI